MRENPRSAKPCGSMKQEFTFSVKCRDSSETHRWPQTRTDDEDSPLCGVVYSMGLRGLRPVADHGGLVAEILSTYHHGIAIYLSLIRCIFRECDQYTATLPCCTMR